MAPLIKNENQLSSEITFVELTSTVVFAVFALMSVIVVLIMCCGDKKKDKEPPPKKVKPLEDIENQSKTAFAESPKECSERKDVKSKMDASIKGKDASQISKMGSFHMQSIQIQDKKDGRNQSYAKGPQVAQDADKNDQSLNLMTVRDVNGKKYAIDFTMRGAGDMRAAKRFMVMTGKEKKSVKEKLERPAKRSMMMTGKEKKSVKEPHEKSVKRSMVMTGQEKKSVKDPHEKSVKSSVVMIGQEKKTIKEPPENAKKGKAIPKHLRPESTHYNIPMSMDM